jgi:hypothetical protein
VSKDNSAKSKPNIWHASICLRNGFGVKTTTKPPFENPQVSIFADGIHAEEQVDVNTVSVVVVLTHWY